MERAIGEVFTFNGSQYKVVEDDMTKGWFWYCMRCVWHYSDCLGYKRKSLFGQCLASYRTDGKNIHFERI